MSEAIAAGTSPDPRVRLFLAWLRGTGWPALHTRTPEQARHDYRILAAASGTWRPVWSVRDALVPTAAGQLPVRVYRPSPTGGRPLVLWFHGGGFVVGDLFTADSICRRLAVSAGATVVSVHYRRAPEHPLPAAHEDAYAAACWAVQHARELGADSDRLVVAGDSAGGGLAAHGAQRLRDDGPRPAALQVLFYPATDFSLTSTDRDPALARLLDWETIHWFAGHSMPGWSDAQRADPQISPLRAADLRGLPPALLLVAGIDPFKADAVAYAAALQRAGVRADLHEYRGQIHGFAGMDLAFPAGRQALGEAIKAIRALVPVRGPRPAADPAGRIRWTGGLDHCRARLDDTMNRFPPVNAARMAATLVDHHARAAGQVLGGLVPALGKASS